MHLMVRDGAKRRLLTMRDPKSDRNALKKGTPL
jgi:hypothetical protein